MKSVLSLAVFSYLVISVFATSVNAQYSSSINDGRLQIGDRESFYPKDYSIQQNWLDNPSSDSVRVRVNSTSPFVINGRQYNDTPANIKIPANSSIYIEYLAPFDNPITVETEMY